MQRQRPAFVAPIIAALIGGLVALGAMGGALATAKEPWVPSETFVERIYREGGAVIPPARLAAYYSADLAPALARDQAADGVGAIGFDWLWSAQDMEITGLSFVETAGGPDGALVEARFDNFGQPTVVNWELCRRPDGQWRVVDVRAGDGSWSLRSLLELPQTPKC